jgi:hypothetical protein
MAGTVLGHRRAGVLGRVLHVEQLARQAIEALRPLVERIVVAENCDATRPTDRAARGES